MCKFLLLVWMRNAKCTPIHILNTYTCHANYRSRRFDDDKVATLGDKPVKIIGLSNTIKLYPLI